LINIHAHEHLRHKIVPQQTDLKIFLLVTYASFSLSFISVTHLIRSDKNEKDWAQWLTILIPSTQEVEMGESWFQASLAKC
jgi:hypothetical protein